MLNQREIFDEIVNNVTINKVAINIGKAKLTLIYHVINGNIQDFYKFYINNICEKNISDLDKIYGGIFKKVAIIDSSIANSIICGNVYAIVEEKDIIYEMDLKKLTIRSPQDSIIDPVNMYGARDGFIESLYHNIALIERRVSTSKLIINNMSIGNVTKTNVCVMGISNHCDKSEFKQIIDKLKSINIDSIKSINDISSLFNTNNMFPLISQTGLPSLAADYLTQGRIIILIDNFPMALVLPVTLNDFTSLRENVLAPPYYSSYQRFITILMIFFSTFFLGLYVAIMGYHSQNLSLIVISEIKITSRGATIPLTLEIIIMLIIFEFVKVASYKAPSSNILNIVIVIGGIIIGQNAVNSGFIGAFDIVVTALCFLSTYGVTNNQYLIIVISILRVILIIIGALFGLLGIICAIIGLIVYLYNIHSLNTKYLTPLAPFSFKNFVKKYLFRKEENNA